MDAMHINSKLYTLLPGDWIREQEAGIETAAKKSLDSREPAPGTDFVSGSVTATLDGRLLTSSSSSLTCAFPALELQNPPFSPHSPLVSRPTDAASPSPLPDRNNIPVANGSDSNGDLSVGLHTFFPPLYFSSGNNTTPETSLIGAQGRSIPLGDGSVANRTSALRELNSNYPSPVLRHGYVKSAGAKNTTYSQPVIVRTYSGPLSSPSFSSHCRRPSSSSRHASQAGGSSHILLTPAPTPSRVRIPAVHGSNHAQGLGEGSNESLLSMARSKVKKGFMPWQWALRGGDGQQDDDIKLPPVEAFTYKGFLADLQAKTSIRADLDRIAEICARSRYSLSDQYDVHVAPHGSGTAFVSGGGQQPSSRLKGRKKGSSGLGGPTLQAVPSDEDESSTRSYRRRRGGIGSGRKRSAAYGTLETIMSSSRSSEEDKSKKKSAAEIAEEIRGRAAKKAGNAATAATAEATAAAVDRKPGLSSISKSSPDNKERKKTRVLASREGLASDKAARAPPPSSKCPKRHSQGRQEPTSFAHAMIDSNHHHLARSDKPKKGLTFIDSPFPAISPTVALLSDPAVAQTPNNLLGIEISANAADSHSHLASASIETQLAAGSFAHFDRTDNRNAAVESLSPQPSANDAENAGFLSGLSSWIPWVSATEAHNGQLAGRSLQAAVPPGPSHAEGSLRGLLKAVDGSKLNKGKDIERPQ